MTTKQQTTKLQLKKPYSLRRLRTSTAEPLNRNLNDTNAYANKSSQFEAKSETASSLYSFVNQNNDDEESDNNDDEENADENIDFVDNIVIYSFSNMRKLKNFYDRNKLKLAECKQVKQKKEITEMDKYLKKLDDNLRTENSDQQKESETVSNELNQLQEDIVWQPNIKKTRGRRINRQISSHTSGSDDNRLALRECSKAHCKLGCICESLFEYDDNEMNYMFDMNDSSRKAYDRDHCGKAECMFECNCVRKLRSNNENTKSDSYSLKKKKRGNNVVVAGSSNSKVKDVEEDNRRISKRIKSAICKIKKVNKSSKNFAQVSGKTKSILDLSTVSKKPPTNSNYNGNGSSSDESIRNKQQETSDIIYSSDEEETAHREINRNNSNSSRSDTEPGSNAATRKSKRVKTMNRKYSHSGNDDHEEYTTKQSDGLNSYYYYSPSKGGQQAKQKKVLNNRLNENFSPKKDSNGKTVKVTTEKRDSLKPGGVSIDENTEYQEKKPDNSISPGNNGFINPHDTNNSHLLTQEEFKPYIKNISLKVTNKYTPSSYAKMLMTCHIFTSKWDTDHSLRMQALRNVAHIVQSSAKTWRAIDFKCETLAIKLTNSNPIIVRVEDNQINISISSGQITSSELVSASQKLRTELDNQQRYPQHKLAIARNSLVNNENIQLQNHMRQDLKNSMTFVIKSLPRLISRNRSQKSLGQYSPNKTGLLLKQVDSLFEKVKSDNSANVSDIETNSISISIQDLRSMNVPLFKDELDYFEKKPPLNNKYPFYNPFSDIELVESICETVQSRDLVENVCSVLNNMISACVTLYEKNVLLKKKEVEKLTILKLDPSVSRNTCVMKPTVIDTINSSLVNLNQPCQTKYPVTITTIKKQETYASNTKPVIQNFMSNVNNNTSGNLFNNSTMNNPHKKSVIYQTIESLELSKQKQIMANSIKTKAPLNLSLTRSDISFIKSPTSETCNNTSPNRTTMNQGSKQQMSMFKFDDDIGDINLKIKPDENNNNLTAKDTIHISTVKTIVPSPVGVPKYKTFVKIVTPEKNDLESRPKIRISSSYLMPARSCLPVSDHVNISAPKIVSMPFAQQRQTQFETNPTSAITKTKQIIIPPNQINKTYLSSFVPIRPKTTNLNPSDYLKSVVSSFQAPSKLLTNYLVSNPSSYSSLKTTTDSTNMKTKQNAIITLVASNKRTNNFENIENNKSDDFIDSENKRDKMDYLEARKRKRKQDLSCLKFKQFESDIEEDHFKNSKYNSEIAALREKYNKNINQYNQLDDQIAYFYKPQLMSALNENNKKVGPLILSKNKRVKNQSFEQMSSGSFHKTVSKNFSSSPDSNESVYSSSTPLPFENASQQALVAYKEDSDEDEYNDEYFRELESIQKFNDEDVVEIDSFDTNEVYNQRISEYSFNSASNNKNNLESPANFDIGNDSDSSDSSLPNITFSSKGMEKSTINNIHSIRERQRRLKLKNLLMKLKIQLFECESDSKYLLDDSVSQKKLDEYCNTRNFNKKTLKSKQNILQEAVNLIKSLQEQQRILMKIRQDSQFKLEKNIGIRNYLQNLQNDSFK